MLNKDKEQEFDSVYLYAKERRSDYLDEMTLKRCAHSNQVYSLLDLDVGAERMEQGFWKKHLDVCEICRVKTQKILAGHKEVEALIPKVDLGVDQKEALNTSCKQLIKGTYLDQSWSHRWRVFYLSALVPAVSDFISCLKKPSVQFAIWAGLAWVILSL